ncbi:MAG TPA: GTPase HflX [Candidatus Cybelea sp.]|jgi:GTP-binding protein HflX
MQRAIVVAVETRELQETLESELSEFEALARAAGATILDRIVQRRDSVDATSLVGSGKALEIAERAREEGADLLFVLNDLRPRQRRNLERIIPLPIVDRTMLILDVFARHARSREGKLQVELAQLRYRQSNLIGIGADLSRLGGGIGTRGPGETKLEVDRRNIGRRIATLNAALRAIGRQRTLRRSKAHREPLVALVGYTNVGKSSLLNALTQSDALVADQPFATLDPTIRRAFLATHEYARVADTVGFITDLPKDLIAAFRATLEELREADLLLHVLDASNPQWRRQRRAVDAILDELELDSAPRLLLFNKSDAMVPEAAGQNGALYVSAKTKEGLPALRATILDGLTAINVSRARSSSDRRSTRAEESERNEPDR